MTKNVWAQCLVKPETSILDALKIIDKGDVQIALVVDDSQKLLGALTDGDVRRALLRGTQLSDPCKNIMNKNPISMPQGSSRESILELMKDRSIRQVPLVDKDQRVVSIEVLEDLLAPEPQDNPIVLMAGGLGQRLSPLTNSLPKPLIPIGKKPILETIITNFVKQGFTKFHISVNYKAEMIVSHFGDGSQFGCQISYLHEDTRLGTAGALSLLKDSPKLPLIVMNGDILSNINFNTLLNFHKKSGAEATMCVREFDYQVPYGVVTLADDKISSIQEKPIQKFFVSAGVYVIEPALLKLVQPGVYLDMPEFFNTLMQNKHNTKAYPLREYWLDIGRFEDLEKANAEYSRLFES